MGLPDRRKILLESCRRSLLKRHVLRVPTVDGVASECGVVAEIFVSRAAVFAGAVGVMEPGDTDAGTRGKFAGAGAERFNRSHDLVAGNHG